MKAAALEKPGSSYAVSGYEVIRELLGPDEVRLLVTYFEILEQAGGMDTDTQVPGSLYVYGSAAGDAVLKLATETLSVVSSHKLTPTYSFARRYFHGQQLTPHRDRAECEHSATLHLDGLSREPWALKLRDLEGNTVDVELAPGDALLYRGDRLIHWRDPFAGESYLQLFLHYVDGDGEFAGLRFDGRMSLGRKPRT